MDNSKSTYKRATTLATRRRKQVEAAGEVYDILLLLDIIVSRSYIFLIDLIASWPKLSQLI